MGESFVRPNATVGSQREENVNASVPAAIDALLGITGLNGTGNTMPNEPACFGRHAV